MAHRKTYTNQLFGEYSVVKNSKARSVRIRFDQTGHPLVTIPSWLPYLSGKQFIAQKELWVLQHLPPKIVFKNNARIGRSEHVIVDVQPGAAAVSARLSKTGVSIKTPSARHLTERDAHLRCVHAAYRSLKRQAEALLEQRIPPLLNASGSDFKQLKVSRTHSRWGSCSSEQTLSFSIFVAQLPDELIDYIIVHEIAHLTHMNHSPSFWLQVEALDAKYRHHRKVLQSYPLRLTLS